MTNPTEQPEERECNCAECREKWPNPTERPEERDSLKRIEERLAELEVALDSGGVQAPYLSTRVTTYSVRADLRTLINEVKEQRELKEEAEATAEAYLARIKQMEEALRGLLDDTQHAEHNCADPDCPVRRARAALDGPSDDAESVYEDPMLAAHAKLLKEDK